MSKQEKNYVPTPITINVSHTVQKGIPMLGWHQNFNEFEIEGQKGTMVFINGSIGIKIGDNSFTFKGQDLIEFCFNKIKKGKSDAKSK